MVCVSYVFVCVVYVCVCVCSVCVVCVYMVCVLCVYGMCVVFVCVVCIWYGVHVECVYHVCCYSHMNLAMMGCSFMGKGRKAQTVDGSQTLLGQYPLS